MKIQYTTTFPRSFFEGYGVLLSGLLFLTIYACSQSGVGSLEGIFHLELETNFEGIQVYLPGTQFRAITDEEGAFVITQLEPGSYTVVAKMDGYEDYREEIIVRRGKAASLGTVDLSKKQNPFGMIAGFASLTGEQVHEGITILLVGTVLSTSTSPTGHYMIEKVPPGTYKIIALYEGWLPASMDKIEVLAGQETTVQEIKLQSAGLIEAQEEEPEIEMGTYLLRGAAFLEGEAVYDGIRVALEDVPEKYTVTSATGFFELTQLDSNPHNLIFSYEGYLDEVIPNAIPVAATSSETVGLITLRKEFRTEGLGILQGRAYLNNMAEHANTILRLEGVSQVVSTDKEGRYMFVGIPAGEYSLVAEHPGYVTASAVGLRVAADQVTQAPELLLERDEDEENQGEGSIRGLALLEGESDHGGITVALEGTEFNTVTSGNGEFQFENIPVNAYTLLFSKGGFNNEYLEAVPVLPGQVQVLEPVILSRDVEPPYVVDSFPRIGTNGIPIDQLIDIVIRFSERMAGDSVKQAVRIEPPVTFDAFFDRESELSDMDVLHLRLFQDAPEGLLFNTRYNVIITPDARTPKGVPMEEPFVLTFSTAGPMILRTFPEKGDTHIQINQEEPIVIETNAPVDPTKFERSIRFRPRMDSMPAFQYNRIGLGTRVFMRASLKPGTRYRLQFDSSMRTMDGKRFENTPYTITFTTRGNEKVKRLDSPDRRPRGR